MFVSTTRKLKNKKIADYYGSGDSPLKKTAGCSWCQQNSWVHVISSGVSPSKKEYFSWR